MSDEFLTDFGHPVWWMPMGTSCAVHAHRSYAPLERHHVLPKSLGGPTTPDNLITVCCNGHYEIHEYLRQLILHNGQVPADFARHFSAKVRKYALQGWSEAGRPTHGGWRVSEQPYGPGAICETCGHFAARHDPSGCHFDRQPPQEDCACAVMRWDGADWPRPWLPAPEGLVSA